LVIRSSVVHFIPHNPRARFSNNLQRNRHLHRILSLPSFPPRSRFKNPLTTPGPIHLLFSKLRHFTPTNMVFYLHSNPPTISHRRPPQERMDHSAERTASCSQTRRMVDYRRRSAYESWHSYGETYAFIYYSEKEIPEMVRSIRGSHFGTVNGNGPHKAADSDGFIPSSIGTKLYRILLGATHFPPGSTQRQLAEDAQKNLISVFRSTKRSESESKQPGSTQRQLAEDAQKNLISVFRSTKRSESESKSKSSPTRIETRA
jgi:hypothetical protein